MPKPTFQPQYHAIENKLIEILIRGHHRWRPDLNYPESHSDMQGAVRELMAVLNIQEMPEDIPQIEIDRRISAMIYKGGMMQQLEDFKQAGPMIQKKTWEAFQAVGLLWWVNRMLHMFGWSIVYLYGDKSDVIEVYPARVRFRGFSPEVESDGFIRLTEHLQDNIEELARESKE
jgi:hypothetical protein